MTNLAHWQQHNGQYLLTALTELRLRLVQQAQQWQPEPSPPELEVEDRLTDLIAQRAEAEAAEPPPALVMLSQQLGLSSFEQNVVLQVDGGS